MKDNFDQLRADLEEEMQLEETRHYHYRATIMEEFAQAVQEQARKDAEEAMGKRRGSKERSH